MSAQFSSRGKPVLITGGAGFIGSNLADRLLIEGESVVLFDNLSRPGVERNVQWLRNRHGGRVRLERRDVRDLQALRESIASASAVFHFAAQVAVTTSLESPEEDFEVNARGTLNVLEMLRLANPDAPLVFTSTNKVYGGLEHLELVREDDRYVPRAETGIRERGLSESAPLAFASPYGCSKGAADQYVLDYAHSFDLPALVFRMSCIYGPRQMGTEDQGWVAHFCRQVLARQPISIYGDGCQVRDLLFVGDLVEAMLRARANAWELAGEAFNIGGGPANAASVLEVLAMIGEREGCEPACEFGEWRRGDQRYYVSDCSKFGRATGWHPDTSLREGLGSLHDWLRSRNAAEEPTPLAA
jgi:CDP-paratose 2-epimerase